MSSFNAALAFESSVLSRITDLQAASAKPKNIVMLAGMRASSAMDGNRAIYAAWISAIPAEITLFLKLLNTKVGLC